MIYGNKNKFAIEMRCQELYHEKHFMGFGVFKFYIGGIAYGMDDGNPRPFGIAYDFLGDRVQKRGTHVVDFAHEKAGDIINTVQYMVYFWDPDVDVEAFSQWGLSYSTLEEQIESSDIEMNKDGAECFDDSLICQFDVDNQVRLVGAILSPYGEREEYFPVYKPETLSDIWLPADEFYGILEQWHTDFGNQWQEFMKTAPVQDEAI